MPKTFYEVSVQWGDTDTAGIVFFPNFYKWMDEASHHFFKTIGYPTSKLMTGQQIGLPLLETHCNFFQPLVFEDDVTVETEVEDVQRKVFRLKHRFYKNGELVAEGGALRAWTSFEGMRPKAVFIPKEVKDRMIAAEILPLA